MPEVILPCPACGCDRVDTHTPEGDTRLIYIIPNAYVSCDDCDMRGPLCSSDHAAIAAWNTLPRALTWTNEPPKVAGWYWCFITTLTPRVVKIDDDDLKRIITLPDQQWAGPIPAPIEP